VQEEGREQSEKFLTATASKPEGERLLQGPKKETLLPGKIAKVVQKVA
jgi:hypothetical protein